MFFVATAPLARTAWSTSRRRAGSAPSGARRAHVRLPLHHRQRRGDDRAPAGERPGRVTFRSFGRRRRSCGCTARAGRSSQATRPSPRRRSGSARPPRSGGQPAGGDRRRRRPGLGLLRLRGAAHGAGRGARDAGPGVAGRDDDRIAAYHAAKNAREPRRAARAATDPAPTRPRPRADPARRVAAVRRRADQGPPESLTTRGGPAADPPGAALPVRVIIAREGEGAGMTRAGTTPRPLRVHEVLALSVTRRRRGSGFGSVPRSRRCGCSRCSAHGSRSRAVSTCRARAARCWRATTSRTSTRRRCRVHDLPLADAAVPCQGGALEHPVGAT